ncbi:hypothetical protein MKX03_013440 [Papaver bracteatum]|nr:hypothetical protein MKX03_013440 [Papaver bracteatum]
MGEGSIELGFSHLRFVLIRQSLSGILPSELVQLPYLQGINLNHNYLSGSIPKAWGSMKLVNISLVGNRLTGPIRKEIGNITTLKELVLDFNQFYGELPQKLGDIGISRMLLSSNNFTGELPHTFSKLTSLEDFRISDNQFTGKIPSFIRNWTNLTRLEIHASGLEGPIPPDISALENLITLRISDLNGKDGGSFPPLNNLKSLKTLTLRSCNINGTLPAYLASMESLRSLDLSFNKLSGEIPKTPFINPSNYLTGNLLTGPLPSWMLGKVNNMNGIPKCLKSLVCNKPDRHYFNINCGGEEFSTNGNDDRKYDDDTYVAGPSNFYHEGTNNWAMSTTGDFMDNDDDSDSHIALIAKTSLYSLVNSELDMTVRKSPLINGNYTVNLRFAEIEFPNDKSRDSLARRVFDVYIQGKRQLKDFDIVEAAGVAGNAVIRTFNESVTSNTLEIRFYWAGKGTQRIPKDGIYGPLISAISVLNTDFVPPGPGSSTRRKKISGGVLAGIVVSVLCLAFILVALWWKCYLGRKYTTNQGAEEVQLKLDWPTRQKICVGIARGLTYLHEESRLKIVHRDIKGTNVLLDKDLNPKISDFGLAKLDEEDNTHISTRIAGTRGYMAPEYALRGYLTDKADIYSFGIYLRFVRNQETRDYMRKPNERSRLYWLIHWLLQKLVENDINSAFEENKKSENFCIAKLQEFGRPLYQEDNLTDDDPFTDMDSLKKLLKVGNHSQSHLVYLNKYIPGINLFVYPK